MLWHVSEEPGIAQFVPRVPPRGGTPVVWAVDDEHLHLYLLPRECPRVVFSAGDRSTPADVQKFLGGGSAVVAVEEGWLDRIRSARVSCYELPQPMFRCVDAGAGYFVTEQCVQP